MLICQECGKEIQNRKGLSYHVKIIHKMQFIDYVVKHEYDGNHPLCACGCNEKVKFFSGKFMNYLDHHQPGIPSTIQKCQKISDYQKKAIRSQSSNKKRSITAKKNHAAHPELAQNTSILMKNRHVSDETKIRMSSTRSAKIASGEIVINRDAISQTVTQKYLDGEFLWAKGRYTSIKTGKECCYRSSYELQYMTLLDNDADVITWEYEPVSLKYDLDYKSHRYIPDFIVTRSTHVELVEVKPTCLRDTEMNEAKRQSALTYCMNNGMTYVEWEPSILQ